MGPRTPRTFPSGARHLAALCLLLGAGCAEAPPPPVPDPAQLQGQWRVTKEGDETTLTIDGDSLYVHARPDFQYDTSIERGTGRGPSQFHATILDTPRTTDPVGDVVLVHYGVEPDTLTLEVVEESDADPPVDREPIASYELERIEQAK